MAILTATESRGCALCDELGGNQSGSALWPKLAASIPGWNQPSRVVASNADYVALITAGPLVRGHCLVLPRAHRSAMQPLGGEGTGNLWSLVNPLVSRLKQIYGKPVLLFEHGTPEGSDNRPCSVSHAHWHLVPTEVGVHALVLPEYHWERTASPLPSSASEYLLVSDLSEDHRVARPAAPIPSQVLRRRLAEATAGAPEAWNWREHTAVDLMRASLSDLLG